MSRQLVAGEPSCIGRSPRYLGLTGSVTSTKEVPSDRPTRANSRPVVESIQPQMPFKISAFAPPMSLLGRNDKRSVFWQSKPLALPLSHLASAPVTGLLTSGPADWAWSVLPRKEVVRTP